MGVTRRDLAAGAALALGAAGAASAAGKDLPTVHGPKPSSDPGYWNNAQPHVTIAMVLYPGMTALDLIGPHYFFASGKWAKPQLVARTREPVHCDRNVTLTPTATFDEIPDKVDVVFVPGGGYGTLDAMDDDAVIRFLQRVGPNAGYVTSVCTGSLVLGAAGLLKGYRATSHWKAREALSAMGATPVASRYVEDRNRITGGGVTAGIDFGLRLASKFMGPDYARVLQLIGEYDPQPPFDSGSPDKAWPETANLVRSFIPDYNRRAADIGRKRLQA